MSVDIEDPVLREQILTIKGKCLFLKREGSVVQGKKGSVFQGTANYLGIEGYI